MEGFSLDGIGQDLDVQVNLHLDHFVANPDFVNLFPNLRVNNLNLS